MKAEDYFLYDNNEKKVRVGDTVKTNEGIFKVTWKNGALYAGNQPIGWAFLIVEKMDKGEI